MCVAVVVVEEEYLYVTIKAKVTMCVSVYVEGSQNSWLISSAGTETVNLKTSVLITTADQRH